MDNDDNMESALRMAWESDDQWALRDLFIRRHANSISDRDRLICLSQLFINIEFLGCQYKPELMQKVCEMSQGLADERRTQRRQIIEQTFVKGSDGKSATLKTKRALPVASQEPKNPFQPKKKKLEDETNLKSPQILSKEKALMLVKAQLSIVPNNYDALGALNFACTRTKTEWRIQLTPPDERHFVLHVADVLVARQSCKDRDTARIDGCTTAIDRLKSINIDVRDDNGMLVLYTRNDRHSTWMGPDEYYFDIIQKRLVDIGKRLRSSSSTGNNAEQMLNEVCQQERSHLSFDQHQLGGWKEQMVLTIDSVIIAETTLQGKQCARDQTSIHRNQLAIKVIDVLRRAASDNDGAELAKVHQRDDGRLALIDIDQSDKCSIDDNLVLFANSTVEYDRAFVSGGCAKHLIIRSAAAAIASKFVVRFDICPIPIDAATNHPRFECSIFINEECVAVATGDSKSKAEHGAALAAIRHLRSRCYSLVTKDAVATRIAEADTVRLSTEHLQSEPLSQSSSIGALMLRKMGWTGGGIGRSEQGIQAPISVDSLMIDRGVRPGFGSDRRRDDALIRTKIADLLHNYAISDALDELVFDDQFSEQHRMIVHREARRLGLFKYPFVVEHIPGLHSRSTGDAATSRRVRVWRRIDTRQLVAAVRRGDDKRYLVHSPVGADRDD